MCFYNICAAQENAFHALKLSVSLTLHQDGAGAESVKLRPIQKSGRATEAGLLGVGLVDKRIFAPPGLAASEALG